MNLFSKCTLWIFFLVNTLIGFTQNTELDSLFVILDTHNKLDTTRVNILNNITKRLISYDINHSKVLLKESEDLANALNYKMGKASCSRLNGLIQLYSSNYKTALDRFEYSKEIYQSIQIVEGVLECNNLIGITYSELSEYTNALKYFKDNLEIYKEFKDFNSIGKALCNIGIVNYKLGDYDEAEKYYNSALKILKENGDTSRLIMINNNIGNLHGARGNFSAALRYFREAARLREMYDDNPRDRAEDFIRIGNAYGKLEDYDTSLKYFNEALNINKEIDNRLGIAMCYSNIGLVYQNQGKIEASNESLFHALKLGEEINSKEIISNVFQNIGNNLSTIKKYSESLEYYKKSLSINLETGDLKNTSRSYFGISTIHYYKDNLAEALNYALKTQKLADELDLLERQKDVYKLLSKIYYKAENYKKAYTSHVNYKILNDSLFDRRNIQKMAQLEYEYEYKERLNTAAQEVAIIDAKLEVSNQQKLLWIISFSCLLLLLLSTFFIIRIRKEKGKKQQILMEQRLLRSQMNPHFIFNTLSAIKTQIRKDQNNGVTYLSKFAEHLRLVLDNSLNNYVLLNKEIDVLKKYMDLQLHRFPNSFTYIFNLENINKDEMLFIPPMLIQPFIENSIKYGFLDINYPGEIVINLKKKDAKYLYCEIKDNGRGIMNTKNTEESSLSTKLISRFIEKSTKSKVRIINLSNGGDISGVMIVFLIPYSLNGYD